MLRELGSMPADAVLSWQSLSPARIQTALAAVDVGLWVVNPDTMVGTIAMSPPCKVQRIEPVQFTEQELEAIEGLLAERTEESIALRMGVTLQRVERIVRKLKEKTDVNSLFLLGVKLASLGFVRNE